jgi:flavin reductase (DIM6/NTAB) family NADH-FMN oxidoreductase RutF
MISDHAGRRAAPRAHRDGLLLGLARAAPLLISIGNDLRSHQLLQQARIFAVNLLDENQQGALDRFAGRFPRVTERLAGLRYHEALTGSPILDDALGWLDCRVVDIVPGGDHTIYLGQVEAGDLSREGRPLLL